MKLSEIASRLGCELDGDGDIEVTGVATLENATERDLSFFTNAKYSNDARKTSGSDKVGLDCPPSGFFRDKTKNRI